MHSVCTVIVACISADDTISRGTYVYSMHAIVVSYTIGDDVMVGVVYSDSHIGIVCGDIVEVQISVESCCQRVGIDIP